MELTMLDSMYFEQSVLAFQSLAALSFLFYFNA